MDMDLIREYLAANSIVGENVFLVEKPNVKELKDITDYIIYNFKEIDGGSTVRRYQLDIRAVSNDPLKAIEIKDNVIQLLDFYYKSCNIKNDDTVIRSCKLVNGGGFIKDNDRNTYNAIIYFEVKL
jgi:hypothetical protein